MQRSGASALKLPHSAKVTSWLLRVVPPGASTAVWRDPQAARERGQLRLAHRRGRCGCARRALERVDPGLHRADQLGLVAQAVALRGLTDQLGDLLVDLGLARRDLAALPLQPGRGPLEQHARVRADRLELPAGGREQRVGLALGVLEQLRCVEHRPLRDELRRARC